MLLPRAAGRDYGFMDPDEWRDFAGFMVDEDQLDALPAPEDVLTNELLPGKIPGVNEQARRGSRRRGAAAVPS